MYLRLAPLLVSSDRAFSFLPINRREAKPRQRGLTEIRGPYYSVMGTRYLSDILETVGEYVDGVKYAGGSFALMPRKREDVARYIGEALIELSTGFISLPTEDLLALIKAVKAAGLKAKPELGIQFGAGGATKTAELAAEGTRDVRRVIAQARRCIEAGADRIMIESEGITESVDTWRTDAVAQIIDELGLEAVMFEAADPPVFEWYIKNYGAEVNLFVDHSQIVQVECLRAGSGEPRAAGAASRPSSPKRRP